MLNRFKLLLFVVLVSISTGAVAQSAPEPAPTPDAAPAVAPAPEAPPSPAPAPAAKSAIPAKPATPPKPEAPKPPAPPEPPRYFQLDYVVKEVEGGKTANSRSYSIIVGANVDGRKSIRAGSKVPVVTQETTTQLKSFQYIDLGVNIDTSNVTEKLGQLSLRVWAEISSLGSKTDINQPIIRQNRWESEVTVPIGKPTTIFSSDDVASTRTMQLELKATPLATK